MRLLEAAQGSKRQAPIPTHRSRLGFAGKANVLGFRTLVAQADAGASHAARDPRHDALSPRSRPLFDERQQCVVFVVGGAEESADVTVRTQRRSSAPESVGHGYHWQV